jgi:hypothetical protein
VVIAHQGISALAQQAAYRQRSVLRRRVEHLGADYELQRHVLPSIDALLQVVLPGAEAVRPGADGVNVDAGLVERDLGGPAVVVAQGHRHFAVLGLFLALVVQAHGQLIVPIGVGISANAQAIAGDALDRETAAIDLGRDVLDDDAATLGRVANR